MWIAHANVQLTIEETKAFKRQPDTVAFTTERTRLAHLHFNPQETTYYHSGLNLITLKVPQEKAPCIIKHIACQCLRKPQTARGNIINLRKPRTRLKNVSWKLARDTRWMSVKCNNKPLSETVPQVTLELSVSTWQKGFLQMTIWYSDEGDKGQWTLLSCKWLGGFSRKGNRSKITLSLAQSV